MTRNCDYCGAEFTTSKPNKRFCSPLHCRQAYYPREGAGQEPRIALASSTRGAISEMIVACDLLERGYEAFRALSPACSCDLIALGANRVPLRIEVRTGMRNAVTGNESFGRNNPNRGRGEDDLDHYGVVFGSEVRYFPELPVADQAFTSGADSVSA